jgi:kumamolisin
MAGVGAPAVVRVPPGASAFVRLLAESRDRGPVSRSTRASFLLLLRDANAGKRAAQLSAMYNPQSRQFGRFTTTRKVAKLGPNVSAVAAARRFLAHHGIGSNWNPGDDWMSVSGHVGALSRLFGVQVDRYTAQNGETFIASREDPRIPARLNGIVTGTSHVSTGVWQHARTVPAGGLTPSSLLKAYDIAPLRSAGIDGSGETVVFFEIDGYRQSDLNTYAQRYRLAPMHPVLKMGPSLAPQGEAEMDIEAVHAVAPGAKLVVYDLNEDSLANNASSESQFEDKLVSFQRTIVNSSAQSIVSNSVGGCANVLGRAAVNALKTIYDRADALGEAWFAASGDQGAYDCLQNLEQAGDPPSRRDIGVDIPASEPGVTGVGGTRISLNSDSSWRNEVAWEGPVETSGSGGGVSTFFQRPSWQNASGVTDPQLNPRGMRSVPDVSAVADPASSGVYVIAGSTAQEGGTSQAAPIWAGIMALCDEYLKKHGGHRLGFANPALYTLARTKQSYPPFHDVTVGTNLMFPAEPGYDMATGLGSPDAWNLARDLLAYEKGGRP